MSLKELRQLRRDRLTLAMMALLPLVQLVLFGYGCSAPIVATNNNAYLGVVTQSSNCWRLGEHSSKRRLLVLQRALGHRRRRTLLSLTRSR